MRLSNVRTGHRLKHKFILAMIRFMGKREPPDVIKTILYRPEFFGRGFSALTQSSMRGESPWTVAERELFAAFVSKMNACVF